MLTHLKARLDKIWLHQVVKFVNPTGLDRVRSKYFHLLVGWLVGVEFNAPLDTI